MQSPLLSIIIPTFNEEKYLPVLLKSIKAQTYKPLEVIVSDAFSQDDTRKIAKSNACVVVDGGLPPVARNNGAKNAKGDILLFLDADVRLPSQFLEETITEMKRRKLDIASCYVAPMSNLKIDKLMHSFANYYLRLTQSVNPHIPGFCIFVKRSLHQKIKGFDESIILGEDHDYVKRAKRYKKFSYLNCYKIPVSVRRLTKEGRLRFALKYLAVELHMIFLGKVISPIVSYKFGDYSKDKQIRKGLDGLGL